MKAVFTIVLALFTQVLMAQTDRVYDDPRLLPEFETKIIKYENNITVDSASKQIVTANTAYGNKLIEQFDLNLVKDSAATAVTACNTTDRYIYVMAEDDIKGLLIQDLYVQTAGDTTSIEQKKKLPFAKMGSLNGIGMYYLSVTVPVAAATCKYEWKIFSSDDKTRKVKVLVFGK